jgi:hypothetical protein
MASEATVWNAKSFAERLLSGEFNGNLHEQLEGLSDQQLHELARTMQLWKRWREDQIDLRQRERPNLRV